MKAIRRNFLLAFIISTFAFFGLLGKAPQNHKGPKLSVQQVEAKKAEQTKEDLILFGVIGLTWVLCFWRCGVINRRLNAERLYQQRFLESMRSNAFQRQYH
jgi:hypothetical protein